MTQEMLARLDALERRVAELERILSGDSDEARAALAVIDQLDRSRPKSSQE